MTIENIIVIIVLIVFLYWKFAPVKGVRNITTAELKNELGNSNKQYIDVRTQGEFKNRSIKGFKNIPLGELSTRSATLAKDKEIYVICQSGMRSMSAAKTLKKLGFEKITNVKGGMSFWR
ncbi:MAG: rhodanese-like domain protein [Bacillales bacterium]|jgi:rhodanese-related sulfurtransferase|nr:rhodanese-like domain protein [Bacillales bacterium]